MSSNELKFEGVKGVVKSEADPRVTAWLADAYAPPATTPAGEDYWNALEQKIMDSIHYPHPRTQSASASGRWYRVALLAAGLLLAAAASFYAHKNAERIRMAYEHLAHPGAVVEPKGINLEPGIDNTTATRPGSSQKGATFKDVIKP